MKNAKEVNDMEPLYPIKVRKDTQVGATTSIVGYNLIKDKKVLLVVPYKSIMEDKAEFFRQEGFCVGEIVSNNEMCNKSNGDMPLHIKKDCYKCPDWNYVCQYSQIKRGMEDNDFQLVIITLHKMINQIKSDKFCELLNKHFDKFILDECGTILNLETSNMLIEHACGTNNKVINQVIGQVLNGPRNEWFTVQNNYSNTYMDYYSDEFNGKSRYNVGRTILFFKGVEYFIDDVNIKTKNNISHFIKFLKSIKKKSIYIDATCNWGKLEKKLFPMQAYDWSLEKFENYKHYIVVDTSSTNSVEIKKRLDKMNKMGIDFLTVVKGKREAYTYKDYEATYYRSKGSRGSNSGKRYMFCTDLPWVRDMHIDTEVKEWEMKEAFVQMAGRVIDPDAIVPSFVFLMCKDIDLVKKFYDGPAQIIPIGRRLFSKHLGMLIDLLRMNHEIDNEDIQYVVSAINSKAKPATTLKDHKEVYRKYRDFILTEWKRRGKLKSVGKIND